jgi:hypothetical protein
MDASDDVGKYVNGLDAKKPGDTAMISRGASPAGKKDGW